MSERYRRKLVPRLEYDPDLGDLAVVFGSRRVVLFVSHDDYGKAFAGPGSLAAVDNLGRLLATAFNGLPPEARLTAREGL